MRYVSARTSWALFALAVSLLVFLAITTDRATVHFADSTEWVSHTREVETILEKLRGDLFAAESGRQGFLLSGSGVHLARYETATQDIPSQIAFLRALTRDNSSQQQRLQQIQPVIEQRMALLQESIALRQSGKAEGQRQDQLTAEGFTLSSEVMALINQMKLEESDLLAQRRQISAQSYARTRAVLGFAFLAVVLLFYANFWQLRLELKDRKRAEASVRRLSGRILQLQDAERRKIARDLHDSIGQYFAGLKMSLDLLGQEQILASARANILAQSLKLVDQGIAETRTLSYLLHPPLLDEVGFASAATWFVEGFTQRSNIAVTIQIPEDMERMPRDLELAMFRVLQEGLTNIHRHSGSTTAMVDVEKQSDSVKLRIKDYGKGISPALLEEFRRTKTGTGVGLAGMRERMVELGGDLDVKNDPQGTTLEVTAPLESQTSAAGNPSGQEPAVANLDAKTKSATASDDGSEFRLILSEFPL
jgi:signal transduction histidine kinase